MKLELMDLEELKPAPYNPRSITDEARAGLANSLARFGMAGVIVWNRRTGNIVGGHQRRQLLIEAGIKQAIVSVVDLDDDMEKALNLSLNNPSIQGEWSENAGDLIEALGREDKELADSLRFQELEASLGHKRGDKAASCVPSVTLPVLDSRTEEWRARRERWDALMVKEAREKSGIDEFDPVLMEFLVKRHTKSNEKIVDLFCGNANKAKVAVELGRKYLGVDIYKERIEANEKAVPEAEWLCADVLGAEIEEKAALAILNVPLFNFVKYGDDEKDLSSMGEEKYAEAIGKAIEKALGIADVVTFVGADSVDADGKRFPLVDMAEAVFKKLSVKNLERLILVHAGGILPGVVRKEYGVRRLHSNFEEILIYGEKTQKSISEIFS